MAKAHTVCQLLRVIPSVSGSEPAKAGKWPLATVCYSGEEGADRPLFFPLAAEAPLAAAGAAAEYDDRQMRFGALRSRGVAAPLLMVVTFEGATAFLALPRPAGRKAPPAATGSRGIPANNEPAAG